MAKRRPLHTTVRLTLFAVSKDKWDTKEDTDRSTKRDMSKGTEVSKSKKIKTYPLLNYT